MEKEIKVTKKDYYAAIRQMIEDMDLETVGEYPVDDVLAFIDKTVSQIDAKATKAKEKASEKKVAGDALRDAVEAVLFDTPQEIDTIVSLVGIEGATKAKVTARLTQLVKAEIACKEQIKSADGRKVMAYSLVSGDTSVDTEAADADVDTEAAGTEF